MEAISKRTGKKFSEKFSNVAVKIGIALRPEDVVEKKPQAGVPAKKVRKSKNKK